MLSKVASSTIFWVFCMTRRRIEPWSSGPLANTLLISQIARSYFLVKQCWNFHYFTSNHWHSVMIFLLVNVFIGAVTAILVVVVVVVVLVQSKWQQVISVLSALLNILVNFSIAVVYMVFILPIIFISSIVFTRLLRTVAKSPTSIRITDVACSIS